MPKILPFKAIRYNPAVIKDLASVVAPPYDVISPKMQDDLYHSHPNNIVRLILNKIEKTDTAAENRYTRAKKYFESWLKDNILSRDGEESFYIYSQSYITRRKKKEQIGLIGLMELDMSGRVVLPHENTLLAPKTDRLNLIREVQANLSPIFVLYDDARHDLVNLLRKFCSKTRPVSDVIFEKVRNRVWRLDDEGLIRRIEGFMAPRNVFIADGHHRYEVARMYAKEIEKETVPEDIKKNSKYLMVYFVESDDRILTILPAHRLIKNIQPLKADEIIKRLSKYFIVSKASGLKAMIWGLAKGKSHCFGMYSGGGNFYLLKLKSTAQSDRAITGKPRAWKRLDVSILHQFIFQYVLGISDDENNIEFVKSPEETAGAVDKGEFKIAFFLNPTKAREVKEIAKLGEKMPRKATYFYPKPLSGLIINKF